MVDNGKLAVTKTANAETPLHNGKTPLLTMDVWGESQRFVHMLYICFAEATERP